MLIRRSVVIRFAKDAATALRIPMVLVLFAKRAADLESAMVSLLAMFEDTPVGIGSMPAIEACRLLNPVMLLRSAVPLVLDTLLELFVLVATVLDESLMNTALFAGEKRGPVALLKDTAVVESCQSVPVRLVAVMEATVTTWVIDGVFAVTVTCDMLRQEQAEE